MTSPKGWDTAEAARLHEYGWLHSLRCERDEDGALVCVCTPARARETWDNTDSGNETLGIRIADGPDGELIPHRRAARVPRGMRP